MENTFVQNGNNHGIYFQQFGKKGPPVIFIHGGFHTGQSYVSKPDGGQGWALDFAEHYRSFVTDLPGCGKSTSIPFNEVNGSRVVKAYAEFIQDFNETVILIVHSLSAVFGYKLVELLKGKVSHLIAIEPAAYRNIQEPRQAIKKSETLYEVSRMFDTVDLDLTKYNAAVPSFFERVTKKYTNRFPNDDASLMQYRSMIQKIHPQLLFEWFNVNNSQLSIEHYENLRETKHLVVTAPDDPFHREADGLLVKDLIDHNIPVTHWKLDRMGVLGNGHMMMLENNSHELSKLIEEWLGTKS